MTLLSGLTAILGKTIFSAASPWGETVGYRALADGPEGERREISAVIARDVVAPDTIVDRAPAHEQIVHVANHATIGVDRPRIGDLLDFVDEVEGDAWEWEVVEVVTGDAGRWQLRVEKRGRYEA